MAKLEQTIRGNFNQLLDRIESGIMNGSYVCFFGKIPAISTATEHAAGVRVVLNDTVG